jgi:hypothetical protein
MLGLGMVGVSAVGFFYILYLEIGWVLRKMDGGEFV